MPNAFINVLGKVQPDVIASNIFTKRLISLPQPTHQSEPSRSQYIQVNVDRLRVHSVLFTLSNKVELWKVFECSLMR